jgi:hypothetical protein
VKGRLMTRVLPDQSIENDRRVDALDVVALVDEPAPPGLLDVVTELDAEWTIVPRATQAAINFRGGKNKTSPLRERNDGVDVWRSHEYRINRIPRISKISTDYTELIIESV